MRVFAVLVMCVLAVVCRQGAADGAHAGASTADTVYFRFSMTNLEWADSQNWVLPTEEQTAADVLDHWRFFLQAFRTVRTDPYAQRVLSAHPLGAPPSYPLYDAEADTALARLGITQEQIARQPTYVFTLQLGAFRQNRSVRSFQRMCCVHGIDSIGNAEDFTGIYSGTPKVFALGYFSDGWYNGDLLYTLRYRSFTRIRYGVYENTADARKDAAVWQRRYGVRATVVRVPLTTRFVDDVLFWTVPGAY